MHKAHEKINFKQKHIKSTAILLMVITLIILSSCTKAQIKNTAINETISATPQLTDTPAAPTAEATPSPTIAPTVVPVVTPDANAAVTSYVTACKTSQVKIFWVNVSGLLIREECNFESDILYTIPYGHIIACEPSMLSLYGDEIYRNWFVLSYEGIEGYIYIGKTEEGRRCVVFHEADLQPLD